MPSFPFSHRRNESDGVFDLEEAEPLAALSNSSGEDDQHLYENDSPSSFPSSRLPSSRLRNRSKPSLIQLAYDHKWVIFALVFGVVVGQVRWRYQDEQLRSASVLAAMVVKSGDVRPGIWEPVDGGQGLAAVGTKQERPVGMQECKRTLLFDWARFEYGFGSTATTFLQAGFFAKTHGYTMLVSRGANAYGSLLDHFDPPPLDCWADEEWYTPERYQHPIHEQETRHAYHIIEGIQKGETPQKEIDRVLVDTDDLYPLNFFARNATFQLPELDSLPELNSQRPFPAFSNIPEIFKQRFLQYSNIANEYFSLNGLMRARVSGMIAEHKLDKPRDSPTVGIHYRGGDKLLMECVPSAQISCGNITLHCETALDSLSAVSHLYPSMDLSSASTTKPRILLMSAEPDALASFQADSLCQKFEVVALGQGGTHKPFVQSEFQQLSAADRLEDARLLLSEGDLLTNFVDTAVVSANSNSARIMFARAGPARVLDEHRMRTVDIYWHPVQFPPFKGKCPGESCSKDGQEHPALSSTLQNPRVHPPALSHQIRRDSPGCLYRAIEAGAAVLFAPETPSRVLRRLDALAQQSPLPALPDLPSEFPSFSEDGDSTVAHSPPQRKPAPLPSPSHLATPAQNNENLPPPTPYSSTPAPSLFQRSQPTTAPGTTGSQRSENDTTATIGPNARFSSIKRGGRATPSRGGYATATDAETSAEHSISEIVKARSLEDEGDDLVVLSGGSGSEDQPSRSFRARQQQSAELSALPSARLETAETTEDVTTDGEGESSALRPHPLDSLGPLKIDSSATERPTSPRRAPSPNPANQILPAALSPLRTQDANQPSFGSPEVGRHSSPRDSPHSLHSYSRDATPSRFNDTSPSSALTPQGAKTPRFDSPLASLDLNAGPATPAANQDAAERRKAHLLGTLRSTAKHSLARGTPHPTRSARKATPRSAGAAAGDDSHDRTSSSFGSDRSSNDLTTFHKANTSLPSGGSADVGGAVGNGARSSRFNGAKLNAYLHSLNTHLTEENKSLAKAVSKVSKDYERIEGENRRLNDTVREMSMAGGLTMDFSRRRTASIEEEDEGERSRVEMLGEELEGLVQGQRRIRSLQDQVGEDDDGEVLELKERLRAAEAELEATRAALEQAQSGAAPVFADVSRADDSQVDELRAECDELRAERDEAKKQLEEQEIEFAEATKQLEEDLCKVTEAQEASLEQARKRLDELESLRREDSALRKEDSEKIARLEAERDELGRQLLEGGTDAAKEMEEMVHSLRGEVAQLEETARSLRSDVAARDEALEKMQEEVEEAERRVEDLKQQATEVDELRRQIVEKDAELQQLDEAFEDSAQQLVQHEDTIDALQKQLEVEQKKSSAVSAQLSQLSLPKTKSPLANEVYNSAKDEIISSLEEELDEARREVDETREKLAIAQQATVDAELRELELKKLQQDKANLEGRIKSLREQSVLFSPSKTPDKSWMLRPLPSVLTPKTPGQFLSNLSFRSPGSLANETITPDLMQIAELQQVVENLRHQITDAYDEVDDKIGRLDSAGSSNLSLARQLSNAECRIAQLEEQLGGLVGEGGSLERVKARLAKVHCPDCQTSFDANKSVQLRVDRNGVSFAGSTPRSPKGDSLRTTLTAANAKVKELQVENDVLQTRASRADGLAAEKAKVLQQYEALERELKQARDELVVLETDLRTERSRLRTRVNEQSPSVQATASLEARASTAETNLKRQTVELDTLREERTTILRGVAGLQDELRRFREDANRHGLDVAAARREGEEANRVREELLVARRKVVALEKQIAEHACANADDSASLVSLKKQHKLEVRGAMKRCLQLQREVSREFAFRVMLDEQKLYLKGVIEEKQATIDLVLSQVGALIGTPLPPLNSPVKRTLRNVALAVVAVNRMRRLAADYAPEIALKKQFREVEYPKVRGRPYPTSSS